MSKFRESFVKSLDEICFGLFLIILRLLVAISMFSSWMLLLWSLGCFVNGDYKEGVITIILSLLSVVIVRGWGVLYTKNKDLFD